jgi:hypothetical protein
MVSAGINNIVTTVKSAVSSVRHYSDASSGNQHNASLYKVHSLGLRVVFR